MKFEELQYGFYLNMSEDLSHKLWLRWSFSLNCVSIDIAPSVVYLTALPSWQFTYRSCDAQSFSLYKHNEYKHRRAIYFPPISHADGILNYNRLTVLMGAIWWGTWGMCVPHFLRPGVHNMLGRPTFSSLLFCLFIWRGFKNKSDVCHVLCEELFMLDGRPHIVKMMLKHSLVWYHGFC